MTIVIFFIILSILVLVHELGHFIAAKKSGVFVEEFGFGLPPRIFGLKIGDTLYSLNILPFGGFVKLYGEEYHQVESVGKNKKAAKLEAKAFINKKPWQKTLILTAGVIGNFLLGWLIISFLFTQGIPTPSNKVIVEKVQKNSPAEQAGLKAKDIIGSVEKNNQVYYIKSVDDLLSLSKKYQGQTIRLKINRNGKTFTRTLIPRKNPPKNQGSIGIVITSFIEKRYSWYQAPFYGLIEATRITSKIINELIKSGIQIITFHKPKVDVTGPIGIAKFTGQAIKFGQNAVLELVALLSLNLAVINIFPFPALDGGRLAFVLYEWMTKKRVNKEFEKKLNLLGITILITLAIIVSINDVIKLYK